MLSGFFTPEISTIGGKKPRVVLDFMDTRRKGSVRSPIVPDLEAIKKIRIGVHKDPKPKLRVVLDLTNDLSYSFEPSFKEGDDEFILQMKTSP